MEGEGERRIYSEVGFNYAKIYQVYFTVTIDGKKVASVENKDPRKFPNVKVHASMPAITAADVAYRNLNWENV